MPPVDPPSEAARETAARLESLTRHLFRLEEGADPTAAGLAATESAALAGIVAGASLSVDRLAAAVTAATADIRDGQLSRGAELCAALVAAADALTAVLLGSGDDALADGANAALAAALAAAPAASPPTAAAPNWPGPSGAAAADLLAQFTAESLDSLQEAESALLDLETQADSADAVNRLFRAVHSIKGTAGYVGLAQIRTLSHKLENVLALVRSGRLPFADGPAEFVFLGVDHLKGMVSAVTPAGEVSQDLGEFVATLDALCGRASGVGDAAPGGATRTEAAFRDAATQHLEGLTDGLRSVAQGDCSDAVLALLHRSASSLGTSAGFVGRPDVVVPADELLGILARLSATRDRLAAAVGGTPLDVPQAAAPPVPAPPPVAVAPKVSADPPPATAKVPPAESARPPAGGKTMRVDQRKLDDYLNLAGELVIARNSLVHAFRQFQLDRSNAAGVKDAVEKVCRIIGDLQENAMGMRMVPVGTVFQRVPRLVRDVAKTLGKQIELALFGEETELDKQVAEGLSDPLVHLIRNAADHGIESPDVRRAAGKPASGSITLRAGREGNAIVIDIQDDGGGIDTDRLKAKAVSTGFITAEQAEALTRSQALDLIFAPGLSTAKVVNDLSGRGVGMDVVRNNIAALGGAVTIRSEPGQGTCIRLLLPLTLAVTTVVLVEANGMTFGLPIDAVQETLKVPPGGFRQLRGVRAIALRGDVIPIKSLDHLVGLARPPVASDGFEASETVPVVVLTHAGTRFGVAVDALKGQQEIVLKPVPVQLGQIDGIGGATIMGDGGIVLILDTAGLYRRAASTEEVADNSFRNSVLDGSASTLARRGSYSP